MGPKPIVGSLLKSMTRFRSTCRRPAPVAAPRSTTGASRINTRLRLYARLASRGSGSMWATLLIVGTRVQGRHSLQTSDALGAAASQLGPGALSLAARILFHFSWTCNDRHVHMFLTSSLSARRRTNHPKHPATQLRLPARRGAETALPAARRPRRSW